MKLAVLADIHGNGEALRAVLADLDAHTSASLSASDGADRQAMHEVIRGHAMAAWDGVQQGEPNPLADQLVADPEVLRYLPAGRVRELLDAAGYVGDAPDRARQMAATIRGALD